MRDGALQMLVCLTRGRATPQGTGVPTGKNEDAALSNMFFIRAWACLLRWSADLSCPSLQVSDLDMPRMRASCPPLQRNKHLKTQPVGVHHALICGQRREVSTKRVAPLWAKG